MVELQLDEILLKYNMYKILSSNARGTNPLKGKSYLTMRDPKNGIAYALIEKNAKEISLILISNPLKISDAAKILKRIKENKPKITTGRLECCL